MSFFFDTKSALAKIENQGCTPATSATSATQETQNTPHVADVAARQGRKAENPPSPDDVSPYGQTSGGRQRTWTGKVVSLDDWRTLSEWERHGSTGKVWNGMTRAWEAKP